MEPDENLSLESRRPGWGTIPEAERVVWARYMLEYPPGSPGPYAMGKISALVLRGVLDVPQRWPKFAAALHAVGFTPLEFYILSQDLSILRLRDRLPEESRPDLFQIDMLAGSYTAYDPAAGTSQPGPARCVLIPEKWANWPLHVRFGRTPARATQHVLTDGAPPPISIDRINGSFVEYTD